MVVAGSAASGRMAELERDVNPTTAKVPGNVIDVILNTYMCVFERKLENFYYNSVLWPIVIIHNKNEHCFTINKDDILGIEDEFERLLNIELDIYKKIELSEYVIWTVAKTNRRCVDLNILLTNTNCNNRSIYSNCVDFVVSLLKRFKIIYITNINQPHHLLFLNHVVSAIQSTC